MFEIEGKYGRAKIFTQNGLEQSATSQLYKLCNQEFSSDLQIRIMPDAHSGKGCVIGTTMTIQDRIVPNLTGVDISCGMLTVNLGVYDFIDFKILDNAIRNRVPNGFNIRKTKHEYADAIMLEELKCAPKLKKDIIARGYFSLGTLGGGNHFIEVDQGDNGNKYLVIHSGSRNIGLQVAEYYQKVASEKHPELSKDLAYLEGNDFNNYVHDMKILQKFAYWNRKAIAEEIINFMGWIPINDFTTVHNYLDIDNMILRKGAVSAQKDEILLIPFNMRDGSVICVGKGNPDWNFSAPHGAGRVHSRASAKRNLSLDNFKNDMKDVYSTCVSFDTLDESPSAYKSPQDILDNIGDTVDIINVLKPIYNFKAS